MGNTVGSHESIAFVARKNQKLLVTPHQLEVLYGSILGDAYIAPQGRIQIEHAVSQQDYLMWKYQELASISYPGKPALVLHKNKRNGKTYESLRFWTRQFFRPLREQFYKNQRKIFPPNLKLTPLMLAVWYMDDGHNEVKKSRCILATDNFDQENISQIVIALRNQFSINPTIRKSGKLAFNNKDKFLSIVGQHVIPAMNYKIR